MARAKMQPMKKTVKVAKRSEGRWQEGKETKDKAFVYGRVSSKKQIDGTGFPRQKQAAMQRAKIVVGKKGLPTMNEVISGTKPLEQRKVPRYFDGTKEYQDIC